MRPQWQLYSNKELVAGAHCWGLTVEQERQRLALLQSDKRLWPAELKAFLRSKLNGKISLEFNGFTQVSRFIVVWLKDGNTPDLSILVAAVKKHQEFSWRQI